MDVLGKVFAMIMVVVLIFLFPLQYLLGHQLGLTEDYVEDEVAHLVDEIRDKRYLDVTMYEGFLKKLSVTGSLYDIEIERAVPKEGTDITEGKDIQGVLVASSELSSIPAKSGEDLYEKNKTGEIFSLAVHTHSDACYVGHRHSQAANNTFIHLHAHTSSCIRYISQRAHWYVCGTCGYKVNYYYYSAYWDSSLNSSVGSGLANPYATTICPNDRSNMYTTMDEGYSYSCGYNLDSNADSIHEIVPNGVVKEYTRVYPQSSDRADYVSGCYSYHSARYFPRIGYYTAEPNFYLRGELGLDYETKFCDIPLYYGINAQVSYNGESGTYSVGYIASLQSDRTVLLTRYYVDYRYTSYTPIMIPLSTMMSLGYSVPNLATYMGKNLYEIYMSGVSIYSGLSSYSGFLKVCSHDDAEINRWVYSCTLPQDEVLACNNVVMSIVPTNANQTVDKGGSIVTTATATMLDGSTKTVNCSSNYNPNIVGIQVVTLTYNGLVDNTKTTGVKTCTTNITVKDTNIPSSISVVPSTNTVYNGTEPTYAVTVTYTSGTTKTVLSGYTKTGWTNGTGIKIVGFSYTENGRTVTTSIYITVKPNITGITVTPAQQSVQRYTNPTFAVRAIYEDSSTASVLGFSVVGFDKNIIGIQGVTIQYTEGGITRTASTTVTVTPMVRTCPVCGTVYLLDANDFDQGCPECKVTVDSIQVSPAYLTVQIGTSLPIVVTATYLDGHTETVTGWSSNYNPLVTGNQLVMITYLGKYSFVSVNVRASKVCNICGTFYALNDDSTDPGCPICSNFLMSISATPSVQSVRQGDTLVLAVMGLYRDGHSDVITGWSSNYNKSKAGEQQVTVYYNNQSCVVRVNVTSEDEIACSVCGTVYNLRDNPWGCPVCAKTLTGIDAILKTGGTKVPFGISLELRVVLIYQDGHREMVFDGWSDNFDPFTMGVQTVTVSYTDVFTNTVSCALSVEVVDRISETVCVNGHVYYANDSAGGCPYCASLSGVGAESLYTCSYTDEILDTLYTNGIYYFMAGDYVTVMVSVKTDGSIFSFKLIGIKEDRAPLSYGGEVA